MMNRTEFDPYFLHQGEKGLHAYKAGMTLLTEELTALYRKIDRPFRGGTPDALQRQVEGVLSFTQDGQAFEDALSEIMGPVLQNSLHVSHERSMAHLHCPPLLPGIMAENIIAVLNQSMDSWDQSPSATYLEEGMVDWLKRLIGYPEGSDGVFTSGGTQSNYMGLLLARDSYCFKMWKHDVKKDGLPEGAHRLRILCSEDAHFTVKKSASQLGLGEKAVVTVPSDREQRMSMTDLQRILKELKGEGLHPFALVATCGTTDFGSIDSLQASATIAKEYELWLHVDAAFGGALLLSDRHRTKVDGLQYADSITIDFHKLWYQPISCGAFMVKARESFRFIAHHAAYLNPLEDEHEGIENLVNKSVQTTRRFDALKIYLSLKVIGLRRFGEMIDHTLELAGYTAELIKNMDHFELKTQHPEINTVVFRIRPLFLKEEEVNGLNRSIQQQLYQDGGGVIAKTSVEGVTCLKLTLLNPRTSKDDIHQLLSDIEQKARQFKNGGKALV
ncbi:pyridoxal phosphate-dependent decarboxylase family protein [Rossellomorea marisflavi]|uniref:pyridoxal phosphate-dependent decarboxylase family protein n=1 Tax=Rossellomorea marisflavi TaxID=189381 RepID=UPI003F9F68B4